MVVGRRGRRADVLGRRRMAWLYDKGMLIMGCWILKQKGGGGGLDVDTLVRGASSGGVDFCERIEVCLDTC